MVNRLLALAKLTRIEHSIMLVIAVIAAELVASGIPSTLIFILSLITPIFISMGAFAINDYYDVESDKLNKRFERPLVSGALKRETALEVTLICMLIGILASAFINIAAFIIALVFAVLAILYSYRLKDILLIGNLYIAFSMVIPFLYGNYVVSRALSYDVILISIVIFLAGLAREIHGMIRDYKGDLKARRSSNLISHVGQLRSAQFAFVLYLEAVMVSIYILFFAPPYAMNLLYIIPIGITDIVVMYISVGYIMQKKTRKFLSFSRNASLAVMALSLIGFLISALYFIRI